MYVTIMIIFNSFCLIFINKNTSKVVVWDNVYLYGLIISWQKSEFCVVETQGNGNLIFLFLVKRMCGGEEKLFCRTKTTNKWIKGLKYFCHNEKHLKKSVNNFIIYWYTWINVLILVLAIITSFWLLYSPAFFRCLLWSLSFWEFQIKLLIWPSIVMKTINPLD